MTLDFEKWDNGRWYVVLPEWTGDQEELEMVAGADSMLDALSDDGFTASIEFLFDEQPDKPEGYIRCPQIEHDYDGATYQPEYNHYFNNTFWLCNVTHFVLDEHPELIYIRKSM